MYVGLKEREDSNFQNSSWSCRQNVEMSFFSFFQWHYISPSSNGITSLIPNSVQSPVLRLWPSASQLSITFAKVWDKQCPGLTHILLLLVVKSGKYCDTHSLRFPSVLLNFLSGLIWESVTSYIIQQSQIWRSKGLGFSKITTISILLLDSCNLIWLPCLHRQKLMYL